ncbi:MAG TPA: hypothetical protein VFE45_01190 [Coriobacteriia bacterium]|nr:hypothetical protein [Coriobacteriia bacterium]
MSRPDSSQAAAAAQGDPQTDLPAHCAELVARLGGDVGSVLEQGLAAAVPDRAIQDLMTMAARLYVAKREAGAKLAPFEGPELTATEVMVTTTSMLKAANLEVFELTMWNGFGTL